MCQGERTCTQLREYLATMSPFVPSMDKETDQAGRQMMERLLRTYFFWKNGLRDISRDFKRRSINLMEEEIATPQSNVPPSRGNGGYQRGGQPPNKRRRVRASSVAASVSDRNRQKLKTGEYKEIAIEAEMEEEAEGIADL
jgi:hypothetical protein